MIHSEPIKNTGKGNFVVEMLYDRNHISCFNEIWTICCVNSHIQSAKVWLILVLPLLIWRSFSGCGLVFIGAPCVFALLTELPVIEVPRRTVLVNNGDSAVLVCNAHGIPTPNITWYRDGIQVSNYRLYTATHQRQEAQRPCTILLSAR